MNATHLSSGEIAGQPPSSVPAMGRTSIRSTSRRTSMILPSMLARKTTILPSWLIVNGAYTLSNAMFGGVVMAKRDVGAALSDPRHFDATAIAAAPAANAPTATAPSSVELRHVRAVVREP